MATHKLFVYGTLKDPDKPDEWAIWGKMFSIFNVFPGVTINCNCRPDKIPGQVIEVTDAELADLDRYEGVPSLFKRERVLVFPLNGDENSVMQAAWVYEYARSTEGLEAITSWKATKRNT